MAAERQTRLRPALELRLPSPIQELHDDRLTRRGVRLLLKRDDLIHPEVPGNKWRKLRYNLDAATEQRHDKLLTFGGAYSNHIRATAAAGRLFGFRTIGVIRGEQHLPLNPSWRTPRVLVCGLPTWIGRRTGTRTIQASWGSPGAVWTLLPGA